MRVNTLLTNMDQGKLMLVSHGCRFVLFSEPMGSCPWVERALTPWLDQKVADCKSTTNNTYFFKGMSPAEAELAFDMSGLAFRSYTRIAIVQNPFTRMEQLYKRIAATDRVWQMRDRVGVGAPEYARWLRSTRPHGNGAGHRGSPRWRRFGSWSVRAWCGDRITHLVRAETAKQDLSAIFSKMGIAPELGGRTGDFQNLSWVGGNRDPEVNELIHERYHGDLQLYHPIKADLRLVA